MDMRVCMSMGMGMVMSMEHSYRRGHTVRERESGIWTSEGIRAKAYGKGNQDECIFDKIR